MYLSSNNTQSIVFRYTYAASLFIVDIEGVFNTHVGINGHFKKVTILSCDNPVYIKEKYK